MRNLELLTPIFSEETARSSGPTTLLAALDVTVTGMGARLLRSWLLRPLLDRVFRQALSLGKRVRTETALGSGAVDLAIAPLRPPDERPGIFGKALFREGFVCVVRKGHPLARKKLTLTRFAKASHALISPRGAEGGFVDDALARLGMRRRVTIAVPHEYPSLAVAEISRRAGDDLKRCNVKFGFRFLTSDVYNGLQILRVIVFLSWTNSYGRYGKVPHLGNIDYRVITQLGSINREHVAHAGVKLRRLFFQPVEFCSCDS